MLNLDIIGSLLALAVLAAVLLAVWRLAAGRPRRLGGRLLRTAIALAAAAVAVAAGAWWLMDSRTYQVAGELVSSAPATADKVVALTFDDGPSTRYVDDVLAHLDRYDAKGTFFVIGVVAGEQPQALRRLVAAGHEIGNHTYTHPRLVGVSVERVGAEVERTDAVIRAAGFQGPILFRPPYCKKLLSAPYYLWRHGRTSVTWDLEPDSMESLAGDPKDMTRYVTANVRPGSIILLHPWSKDGAASRRALPLILKALAAKGYRFVTVSELLQRG